MPQWFLHGTIGEAVLNCRDLQTLPFGFSGYGRKVVLILIPGPKGGCKMFPSSFRFLPIDKVLNYILARLK